LRKQESYITKCNDSLIFRIDEDEISLTVTNSVLTKFLKNEKDLTFLDAQDIEEFLSTCGPVTVTYTTDNHVIDITKSITIIEDESKESDQIDEELCTITDAVTPETTEQKVRGEKRHGTPTQHLDPKQTQPTKDSQ